MEESNEQHLSAMTELNERLQKDKEDSLQSLKTSVTAEKQVRELKMKIKKFHVRTISRILPVHSYDVNQ